jgi:hypothetical protein
VAFLAATATLILLGILAVVGLGFVEHESTVGILRDGIPRGQTVPPSTLPDTAGTQRRVPSEGSWQLLVFGDHSLKEFPGLVDGLRSLISAEPDLEVLLLPRGGEAVTAMTLEITRIFELHVAVVPTSQRFYQECNVRVMPFVMFVDSFGVSRAQGMVNDPSSLFALWTAATLPLSPPIHSRNPAL